MTRCTNIVVRRGAGEEGNVIVLPIASPRAFHDAVLELGSVLLPVVTARIERFIAESGKGPYPDME